LREINGVKYYEPVTTYQQISQSHVMIQRLATMKAVDLGGKPIDAKKLAQRLKQETTVLVTYEHGPIDPFYLQLIKPDTIILAMPPLPPVEPAPRVLPNPPPMTPVPARR
jgi:hypothetical protein